MANRSRLYLVSLVAVSLLGACRAQPSSEAARTLLVPGDVNHEAFHALERARGRHLTREELLELHRVWIDNEVLFREGRKQRSSLPDGATREQVISAAQRATDAQVRPPPASDEELRRWFEAHRERYEAPARLDFEDVSVPGPASEAAVRALVEQLNRGAALEPRATLRAFQARPESSLGQAYGASVARALAEAEPGTWRALLAKDGWRAMRLVALRPATRGGFEAQREAVRRDLTEATVAERRRAAIRALWAQYDIQFAEATECLADKG